MAKPRSWEIPEDGVVLSAAHLRDHTVFTLAEAGRGPVARGGWGFVRPPGAGDGAPVNRFKVKEGGDRLEVENLALIAPEGVLVESPRPIGVDLSGPGPWKIMVSWNVADCKKGRRPAVGIEIGDPSGPHRPAGCLRAPVGAVSAPSRTVTLEAPALSLDCHTGLEEAWKGLRKAFAELAGVMGESRRGTGFARTVAAGALRRVAAVTPGSGPALAVDRLWAAAGTFAAFVEDDGPDEVRAEARSFEEAAKAAFDESGAGLDALRRSLGVVGEKAEVAMAREWLVDGKPIRLDASQVQGYTPSQVMWRYQLRGRPPGTIRIKCAPAGKFSYALGETGKHSETPKPVTESARIRAEDWENREELRVIGPGPKNGGKLTVEIDLRNENRGE